MQIFTLFKGLITIHNSEDTSFPGWLHKLWYINIMEFCATNKTVLMTTMKECRIMSGNKYWGKA